MQGHQWLPVVVAGRVRRGSDRRWRATSGGAAGGGAGALDRPLVGAEVRGDDPGVVAHLVGRALGDDRAGLEAVDAVADRHHERHVVLDDEQRRAELGLDAGDERGERLGLALGDAGGGLVEADDPGLEGEDARQLADAAGAGRQRADEVVGEAAEAQVVDEVPGPGELLAVAAPPGRDAGEHREHPGRQHPFVGQRHGLEHGQVAEQAGVLERAPEAALGPPGRRTAS